MKGSEWTVRVALYRSKIMIGIPVPSHLALEIGHASPPPGFRLLQRRCVPDDGDVHLMLQLLPLELQLLQLLLPH